MTIHLDEDIFEVVKNGTKKIELRVNVEKLEYYNNFKEAIDNYEIEDIYTKEYTKEDFIELLSRFYSNEEIEKYGVVAIKFKIIKK